MHELAVADGLVDDASNQSWSGPCTERTYVRVLVCPSRLWAMYLYRSGSE